MSKIDEIIKEAQNNNMFLLKEGTQHISIVCNPKVFKELSKEIKNSSSSNSPENLYPGVFTTYKTIQGINLKLEVSEEVELYKILKDE